jgi:hypothetical protein
MGTIYGNIHKEKINKEAFAHFWTCPKGKGIRLVIIIYFFCKNAYKISNFVPNIIPFILQVLFEVNNGKKFNTTKVQIEAPGAIWAPYLDNSLLGHYELVVHFIPKVP